MAFNALCNEVNLCVPQVNHLGSFWASQHPKCYFKNNGCPNDQLGSDTFQLDGKAPKARPSRPGVSNGYKGDLYCSYQIA